jgi:KDO2-lipid IV(A) lauroyltransferase
MRSALGIRDVHLLTLKVFMNQAEILVDAVRYAYLSDKEIREKVVVKNSEFLDEALASGRGLMMITGHIGNWEILSHLPRLLGTQFCVMADQREDPRLESIVDRIRTRSGATILPPRGKALMLIRELRKGSTIGMVIDGRGDVKDGPFCDVFGLPAPTNPAPAFIAIKGRAIVLPVAAVKIDGTYHITFHKPVYAVSYGTDEDAARNVSVFMQSWVASVVKDHPEQWFWLYSRWLKRSDMKRVIKKGLDFKEHVFSQANKKP